MLAETHPSPPLIFRCQRICLQDRAHQTRDRKRNVSLRVEPALDELAHGVMRFQNLLRRVDSQSIADSQPRAKRLRGAAA